MLAVHERRCAKRQAVAAVPKGSGERGDRKAPRPDVCKPGYGSVDDDVPPTTPAALRFAAVEAQGRPEGSTRQSAELWRTHDRRGSHPVERTGHARRDPRIVVQRRLERRGW